MRRVLIVGAVVMMAAGACSKSKLAEGDLTPTTPPAAGAASTAAGAPTTAAAVPVERPEVCKLSDDWGLYIIRLTDPAQAGGLTPEQLATNVDQAAAALKAQLADHAGAIDTRTEVAKKRQAGSATDEDNAAEEAAVSELNTWYVATCQ